jgi:thiamine-phosphate pyrophosphorylase
VRLRPPLLCLVTDRHRLGARLGLPPNAESTIDALLTQVTAAGAAGVSLIQVREPDLPAGALVGLVRAIRARVAAQDTLVVVNDRLDIALASRADGVHLKSSSVAVGEAARLAPPPFLIGRSVHSLPEIARGDARGADYVIVGTVWATESKPAGWQTLGLAGLAAAVHAAAPMPVLGIGGISADQAADVARTGAAGVAAIAAFLPSDPAKIADTVYEAVRRMRMAFDSTLPPSQQ